MESITDMGSPLCTTKVNYRRSLLIGALKAARPGKVHVFFRGPVGGGHSYIHAKTWIFDDQFAVIGSANTNRRSWTHDSEVAVGICDKGDGKKIRMPPQTEDATVGGASECRNARWRSSNELRGAALRSDEGDRPMDHPTAPTAYVVPYDETQRHRNVLHEFSFQGACKYGVGRAESILTADSACGSHSG